MKVRRKEVGTILRHVAEFVKGEHGLVTVEWVSLAAAMVVGAVSIGWLVAFNLKTPSALIGTKINSIAATTITQQHP